MPSEIQRACLLVGAGAISLFLLWSLRLLASELLLWVRAVRRRRSQVRRTIRLASGIQARVISPEPRPWWVQQQTEIHALTRFIPEDWS